MKTDNLGSIVITIALIFFAVIIVFDSFSYIPAQQMIPLIVAVFTLICLFATLGVDLFSKRSLGDSISNKNLEDQPWPAVLQLMGWIVLYLIFIFILGFLLANLIFVFAYLLKRAKLDWSKAMIFSAIVTAAMYGFFNLALKVDLWPGVVPELIPKVLGGGNLPPL